jgi:hypothetical protein
MGNSHTFQNIKADTAKLIDIGVVYLGQKSDLWWSHRIVIWQEKLELEDAACRGLCKTREFPIWLHVNAHLRMGTG